MSFCILNNLHSINVINYRLETIAAAERNKITLEAEAEAESIRMRGEAKAFAVQAKATAEAEQMVRIIL